MSDGETWSWMTPSTDSAYVAQDYDKFAADSDVKLTEWGYDAPTVAAQLLLQQLGGVGRVLDAGCGTGWTGVALAKAGFGDVVGIDVSAESIIHAAQTNSYTQNTVHDLTQPLPFPDKSFDATICIGVLSYLHPADPVLREFARVTRPGGIVLFTSRTDLWESRDYAGMLARLSAESVWEPIYQSDPQPYLPGHPDYTDDIQAIYVSLQIK